MLPLSSSGPGRQLGLPLAGNNAAKQMRDNLVEESGGRRVLAYPNPSCDDPKIRRERALQPKGKTALALGQEACGSGPKTCYRVVMAVARERVMVFGVWAQPPLGVFETQTCQGYASKALYAAVAHPNTETEPRRAKPMHTPTTKQSPRHTEADSHHLGEKCSESSRRFSHETKLTGWFLYKSETSPSSAPRSLRLHHRWVVHMCGSCYYGSLLLVAEGSIWIDGSRLEYRYRTQRIERSSRAGQRSKKGEACKIFVAHTLGAHDEYRAEHIPKHPLSHFISHSLS